MASSPQLVEREAPNAFMVSPLVPALPGSASLSCGGVMPATTRSSSGAPHRAEGCLPASRSFALEILTLLVGNLGRGADDVKLQVTW